MAEYKLAGYQAVLQLNGTQLPPTEDAHEYATSLSVTDISDFAFTRAMYDATAHGEGIYRDRVIGLADPVDLTFTANYVVDGYTTLWDLCQEEYDPNPITHGLRYWRILWPDDYCHTFTGYVTGVTPTTPLDERITYQFTIGVTGPFEFGLKQDPAA